MSIGNAQLGSASFYQPVLFSLARTSGDIATSAERLSSGNRLVRAGDDVAALSISSRLSSQVVALKAAQSNTSQGSSLLQVAYDGLAEIRDVLDRMKTLAIQADSGALTTAERELLQQEFSALNDEVDRIAENTSFGSLNLLDGTVSGENTATTTTTKATQASATLAFTANPTAGQTVILNGVTFTAAASAATSTEFTIGGSTAATISNLVTVLNNSTDTRISQATYSNGGTATLTITQDAGGTLGNQYTVNQASSTTTFTTSGASTQVADFYTLQNGANDGLRQNSVIASGSIGDSLVNTQSQVQASVTLTLTGAAANGELLRIDNGNGSYVDFTFATTASTSTDIQIGADTQETLQNAIETITQYTGTSNFGSRQLEFERDGDQLIIRNKNVGDPGDFTGADLDITETLANGTLTASALSNGATTGVNTSGVNNGDFIGTIDGFTATYNSADNVTASVTVGSHTYTATISDTTPGTATSYRFHSTSGGYFDVQLASGGLAVANQTNANTYASRLNAAFSTLTFYQSRNLSSFSGTGGLAGASAEIKSDDFGTLIVRDITVTAPSTPSGDATIDITVSNGATDEIFRAQSSIGDSIGAYETFVFTSLTDGNKTIRLTNGATPNSFDDATNAATFQDTLRDSFGLTGTGTGRDFRVGEDAEDIINVNIGDARTTKLFVGVTPSIDTQGDAEDAQDTLDTAIARVDQILADVGAYQSRFDTAYNQLGSTQTYVEQARSTLADTDVATESTNFATAILKANAATAVIAQVAGLQKSLLDVVKLAA